MTIKLEITAEKGTELAEKLLATLGAFSFAGRQVAAPPVAENAPATPPEPEVAERVEEPKRRGRKPKTEETPVAEEVPAEEEADDSKFETAPVSAYTTEDCMRRVKDICLKLSTEVGVALLRKYLPDASAPKVSLLAPDQFPAFIADADRALEVLESGTEDKDALIKAALTEIRK